MVLVEVNFRVNINLITAIDNCVIKVKLLGFGSNVVFKSTMEFSQMDLM